MSALTIHFQHSTGSSRHYNKPKKEKKKLTIGRKEIKLSLFVNDMILYIEILKESQEKTPRTNK